VIETPRQVYLICAPAQTPARLMLLQALMIVTRLGRLGV